MGEPKVEVRYTVRQPNRKMLDKKLTNAYRNITTMYDNLNFIFNVFAEARWELESWDVDMVVKRLNRILKLCWDTIGDLEQAGKLFHEGLIKIEMEVEA